MFVTDHTILSANAYIEKNWINQKPANFFKSQVAARGAYFLLAPTSLLTCAIDTIVGLGLAVGSIAAKKNMYNTAYNQFQHSRFLIVYPWACLLHSINPKAVTEKDPERTLIAMQGNGLLTEPVNKFLTGTAETCADSRNLFKRYVCSRLTYALRALACLVTRVVDGIIGIIAGTFALLTVGKIELLNHVAYRGLQAPGIIEDLVDSTVRFINPWAGKTPLPLATPEKNEWTAAATACCPE